MKVIAIKREINFEIILVTEYPTFKLGHKAPVKIAAIYIENPNIEKTR